MSVVEMLEDGSMSTASALIKEKSLTEVYHESHEYEELKLELESIKILGQLAVSFVMTMLCIASVRHQFLICTYHKTGAATTERGRRKQSG